MEPNNNLEFINDTLSKYIDNKKRIEIIKVELKQLKSENKNLLDQLIDDGEKFGVDINILELLKSLKIY